MKVLVLSNKVPYPAKDGSTLAIKSVVDALLQNQVEVCLMALNTLKHFKEVKAAQKLKPNNLELHCYRANTNLSASGALKNLLKPTEAYHVSRFYQNNFATALLQKLKAEKFDVIQLEGLSMAVYLPLIKEYCATPVVLRAHNLEYLIWQRHLKHEKNPLKKTYLKLQTKRLKNFEQYALGKVNGVAFITEVDEKEAHKLAFKGKSIALPSGVNLKDYVLEDTPPIYDLTYLASFDWMPNTQGFEWFVKKVWPLILKSRPNTTIALGGRNMPPHFKDFEKLGITVSGSVANAQKFITLGRLVVVPLLAGSGMRIKIIENLALQKAMVATPLAAEGIAVTHGKNISLAARPADFAKAVVKLLDNPQEREDIAKQARALITKKYNNPILGQQLIQFYHSL